MRAIARSCSARSARRAAAKKSRCSTQRTPCSAIAQRRARYDLDRLARPGAAPPRHAGRAGAPGHAQLSVLRRAARTATRARARRRMRPLREPAVPAERHRLEYSGQRMLNRIPKRHAIDVCVTWPQTGAAPRRDARPLVERHAVRRRPCACSRIKSCASIAASCARSRASRTSSATRTGGERFTRRRRVPDAAVPARSAAASSPPKPETARGRAR